MYESQISTTGGNLISGNSQDGVYLSGILAFGNTVAANYIGTDATGTTSLSNGSDGVLVSGNNNTIGGTMATSGNLISGNTGNGVNLTGNSNTVLGNQIGTNVHGTASVANASNGVQINGSNNSIGFTVVTNSSGTTTVYAGNTIADNATAGISLVSPGSGNALHANSIFTNGPSGTRVGIARASGANNNQAAPVLSTATYTGGVLTVTGTLTAAVSTAYTLEFFGNPATDPEKAICSWVTLPGARTLAGCGVLRSL